MKFLFARTCILRFFIPKDKLTISFSRSSGPGGQNVNKVETKCEIRFHVDSADWIPSNMKQRISQLFRHLMNKEGELIVISSVYRTQSQNVTDALEKLNEYLKLAEKEPKVRVQREGRSVVGDRVRLKEKKIQSEKKQMRRDSKHRD